jgi:hypothetical protein
MHDECLAVDADAVTLGQRRAFAPLRVFFEIDNLFEDLFDAEVSMVLHDFTSV